VQKGPLVLQRRVSSVKAWTLKKKNVRLLKKGKKKKKGSGLLWQTRTRKEAFLLFQRVPEQVKKGPKYFAEEGRTKSVGVEEAS